MNVSVRTSLALALAILGSASCAEDEDPIGPGSFILAITPTERVTAPGTTTFVTVQLQRTGSYSGPITLTISNTPAGVSASMDPAVFSGSTVESRLNLTIAPTAQPGSSTVTVKGTASVTEYTVNFALTIAAPN
jgi:hypothetical protein